MNSVLFSNIFRFVLLLLLQVLVLRQVALEWPQFPYINILVYPLFLFLLPLRTPRYLQFILAFGMGLLVDLFYDSPGVHASAAVFTIYLRYYVLKSMEPRGGYNINYSPTKRRMGLTWWLRYSSILLLAHCFVYFSVEAFTFFYILDILLKTGLGFLFSLTLMLIITAVFNPLD